jgi:hypothetical protein
MKKIPVFCLIFITITFFATNVLGERITRLDNTNTVMQFGSIDYPSEGEIIHVFGDWCGFSYSVEGWFIQSQLEATVPSPLSVYVDGVYARTAVYVTGKYSRGVRHVDSGPDSDRAGFCFELNTRVAYPLNKEGLHSVRVVALGIHGNTEIIDTRYFCLYPMGREHSQRQQSAIDYNERRIIVDKLPLRNDCEIIVSIGYRPESSDFRSFPLVPDNGMVNVSDTDRLILNFGSGAELTGGYLEVGNDLRSLPPGSMLGLEKFFWQLDPVFSGVHNLIFTLMGSNGTEEKTYVRISVCNQ